jgi:CcmD family protein
VRDLLRRSGRSAGAALLLVFGAVAAVAAQEGGQSAFQAVPGGVVNQERLPATPLVFAAYALVWVILIAYVFLLWRRLGRVEHELADLTKKAQAKAR